MNRRLIYTAYLLGVLFVFPLVYQSWHRLTHHQNVILHVSGLQEHLYEFDSNSPDVCPICHYEFSNNNLPPASPQQQALAYNLCKHFKYTEVYYFPVIKFQRQSRAPPWCV